MRADFAAEHIDLLQVQFAPELLGSIPVDMVRKFRLLPISQSQSTVGIAMADPSDLNAVDTLARFLNRIVHIYVADQKQIADLIERLYGRAST